MDLPPDYDEAFLPVFHAAREATMSSSTRMYALYKAVHYVVDAGIPGDFVECGVWRGGSVMVIAMALLQRGVTDRVIHLFDTFEGMPAPSDRDVSILNEPAAHLLATQDPQDPASVWCVADLNQVKRNVFATGYPEARFRFVPGRVEDTIPAAAPHDVALLRLDTDWYESTRHELEQLYPRLAPGGVLIIDDYGHWRGSRQAVDEYFSARPPILLNRIDYTGRIGVKTAR
ncbi:TylF/MycF/NovP-related O-methyltransferase [Azospirillum halopraeferens]|uniref:TylF/MycF/NovP-related O-methyltransferase n=1 Tax=Azospirillum halopraeferens TaxID=34010 RepID=UPI0003FD2773|nr:TylF/MycF/NovP-related O-methyltransferase [Azospirillum halopraeferens]